ncbi:MAG: YwbE family protein [Bacteroidota bacterium]
MEERDGSKRNHISVGTDVAIVQKHHQRTGQLTEGTVSKILTKSAHHPHGIKVMLETGEVGRVKVISS